MMRERAHGRQRRALLSASLGGGGNEDTDVFAVKPARLPLLPGLVPERLPLGGEGAVAGRDAEEEGVVLFELVRRDDRDGTGLAGRVHLGEHFVRESFLDPFMSERKGRIVSQSRYFFFCFVALKKQTNSQASSVCLAQVTYW